VIFGKVKHQAKRNNKALLAATNKHTFHQFTPFQLLFLCSKHYVMYSYRSA